MKKKFFFAFLLVFIFFGFYLWQGIYLIDGYGPEKIFKVEKGQGLLEVGENLEKAGLVKNRFFFDLYILLRNKQSGLQAGAYRLKSSLGIPQIAREIVSGNIAKVIVTIPEGFTKKQIEERLGFALPGDDLEGYLFPDTYEFPIGFSGEDAARVMKNNFEKKTADLKVTPEIIVLASLLEKEVKTKEEKELVAGVLWKRLAIGMPLQVDADPWTYQNRGLPPSPIANPGLESILAAISPKESPYWYYLSTTEGKTIFSKTLAEHNSAKAKYLR